MGACCVEEEEVLNTSTELTEMELEVLAEATIDEELADTISYLKRAKGVDFLSRSDEYFLFKRYKQTKDENLLNEIITKYTRFVYAITNRYCVYGDGFEDCIQEGMMGLLRAVELYDVDKGFRFTTYAFNWISQFVTRYLTKNTYAFRVPVNQGMEYLKIKQYYKKMTALGVTVSVEDVMSEFNMNKEDATLCIQTIKPAIRLDYKNEEGSTILDCIKDSNKSTEKEAIEESTRGELKSILSKILNPREVEIILNRFGFNGEVVTLDEIGSYYNLTRERVRQIEKTALNKIRMVSKKYGIDSLLS